MDYNYTDLKKKRVINVEDGKDLGKITDLIISYPDGRVKSIIVPGKRNAIFSGCELIIAFSCIERVGDDTVLVRLFKREEKPTRCAEDDCIEE